MSPQSAARVALTVCLALPLILAAAEPPPSPQPASSAAPAPVDAELLRRCNLAADYSKRLAGDAVLVMVGGKVVFERYEPGMSAQRPHMLASGTKSFLGVLAACAVQDGLMTFDEKVAGTITEWQSDPARAAITVRHLLTMSSGLAPNTSELTAGLRNAGIGGALLSKRPGLLGGRLLGQRGKETAPDPGAAQKPVNFFSAAIAAPMVGTPGGQFQYGPVHLFAFGEFLQRKLAASSRPEKTFRAYLQSRLFDPLGLPITSIRTDAAGNPDMPGGGVLTARAWASFGQFVLLGGVVPEKRTDSGEPVRIVDESLLAECFKPSASNPLYGLTWWLPGQPRSAKREPVDRANFLNGEIDGLVGTDGKPVKILMAAGLGKQRLYVLPEFNMVVVRFAKLSAEGAGFSNAAFLGPILGLEKAKP